MGNSSPSSFQKNEPKNILENNSFDKKNKKQAQINQVWCPSPRISTNIRIMKMDDKLITTKLSKNNSIKSTEQEEVSEKIESEEKPPSSSIDSIEKSPKKTLYPNNCNLFKRFKKELKRNDDVSMGEPLELESKDMIQKAMFEFETRESLGVVCERDDDEDVISKAEFENICPFAANVETISERQSTKNCVFEEIRKSV